MGWHIRASGNLYKSLSGPYFIIGFCSGKFLSGHFFVKKFTRCDSTSQINNEPELDYCPCNYLGISKSMKSDSALVSTKYAFYKKGFIIDLFIFDNKPTIKCSWKTPFKIYKSLKPDFLASGWLQQNHEKWNREYFLWYNCTMLVLWHNIPSEYCREEDMGDLGSGKEEYIHNKVWLTFREKMLYIYSETE